MSIWNCQPALQSPLLATLPFWKTKKISQCLGILQPAAGSMYFLFWIAPLPLLTFSDTPGVNMLARSSKCDLQHGDDFPNIWSNYNGVVATWSKTDKSWKKGSFFLIKTLTLEMSPIGMIQETRKKNWNKWRRGGNRQKTLFFWRFFRKSWKFLSKNHGWWKKEVTKMNLF